MFAAIDLASCDDRRRVVHYAYDDRDRRSFSGTFVPATRASTARKPRDIYADLRRRIEAGEFGLGKPFPTEERLCADEQVSRYALREALAILQTEGLISRRRGAGTRVISRTPTSVFRHATGSRAELLSYVQGTTITWSGTEMLRADGALARLIGCDEMREWQHVWGVRKDAEGDPLALVHVYVDPAVAPLEQPFAHNPIYEWVEERHGIRVATLSQDIRARHLSAAEADALGEATGAAVLQMTRRYFDAANQSYMISQTTHRARDFVYNLRVQIKD